MTTAGKRFRRIEGKRNPNQSVQKNNEKKKTPPPKKESKQRRGNPLHHSVKEVIL